MMQLWPHTAVRATGEEERDAEASIGAFFHPGMTTPILGIAGLHAAFVCVAPRCREAKKTALSGG